MFHSSRLQRPYTPTLPSLSPSLPFLLSPLPSVTPSLLSRSFVEIEEVPLDVY